MRRQALGIIAILALALPGCGASAIGSPPRAALDVLSTANSAAAPAVVVVAPLGRGEEPYGYPLYSYLLYRTRPASTDINLAIFGELLRHPFATEFGQVDASNLTSVPLTAPPTEDNRFSADYWIQHYDLGHSCEILTAQQIAGDGPFIVTYQHRLGTETNKRDGLTILDLSGVTTPEAGKAWVRHFVDASEHPEHWATNGAQFLFLTIESWASSFGLVVQALPNGNKILKAIGADG